jgi:hypothetical protein
MSRVVEFSVDSVALSGLEARPSGPARATVLALHGGGYSARYWDNPSAPDASLLNLARCSGTT